MFKGIRWWFAGTIEADTAIRGIRRSAIEGFCIFVGELAFEELFLDGLEGDRFGAVGLGEVGVEVLHEEGGGGVVDEPEGGHDGFGSAEHEVMAHSCDFESFFVDAAFSSFAGAEDDEVGACEGFHGADDGW